jgi:ankyrin repeat protein
MAASRSGWGDIVQLLLDAGADVNASTEVDENETALMVAAAAGHEPVVRLLLEHGANRGHQNVWAKDAAQLAMENGHTGIAKLLRES